MKITTEIPEELIDLAEEENIPQKTLTKFIKETFDNMLWDYDEIIYAIHDDIDMNENTTNGKKRK